MAYLFAPTATDRIDAGAITAATTWSVYCRFAMTGTPATVRRLAVCSTTDAAQYTMFLQTDDSQNLELGFTDTAGANFNVAFWLASMAAGVPHAVVGTYEGANLILYADGDGTPKDSQSVVATPDTTGVEFAIGNIPGGGFSVSADATIYEVGWWAATALTGPQAVQVTTGDASGIPVPSHYWGCVRDPVDRFGGTVGSVTGAQLVAHVGPNLYPSSQALTLLGVG